MKNLFIRILRQLINDKRSLILIILAPLFILSLLYLLLGDSNYQPTIAIKQLPIPIVSTIKKQDVTIVKFDSNKSIKDYLKDKEADAFF